MMRGLELFLAIFLAAASAHADGPSAAATAACVTGPANGQPAVAEAASFWSHLVGPTVSCSARFREACARLRAGGAGVIARRPDHTVAINPLTLARDWPAQDRALLLPENVDQNNFQNNIRPLFLRMKAALEAHVAAMPAADPQRAALLARLQNLDLRVENFDRCQRPDRTPLVARFDGANVLMCPVVSHLRAPEVASMLAHELGHSVDPCDENLPEMGPPANYAFSAINQCASRIPEEGFTLRPLGKVNCDRNNEIFADYISAAVTNEVLRPEMFSSDPATAALELGAFRVMVACDPQGYDDFISPIFQNGVVERTLQCSGFETPTICAGLVAP